jgi:hypothetical protein
MPMKKGFAAAQNLFRQRDGKAGMRLKRSL